MRINNPTPFKITQQENVKHKQKQQTTTVPADRTRSQRVLVGQRSTDQWLTTTFPDFSTMTLRHVSDLFDRAVSDPQQTALLVHRLVCHAPSPAHFRLSESALRVLRCENAGGASEFSEAVSMEVLHRVFDAQLERTEMSIDYLWNQWSKKTDYTCRLRGEVVAVSVTRAMRFAGRFTETDAFNLLRKKLYGCQMSNRDVVAAHSWTKQVLHVFTEQHYIVDLLRTVFEWFLQHQPELVGNTVVLITHAVDAPFLFFNFCSDQAHMQFVHAAEAEPVMTDDAFTTPACAEASAATMLCFERASDDETDESFFYGLSAHAKALEHNAVASPLEPKEEDIWENEGLGSLFAEEEEVGLSSLFAEEEEEEDVGLSSLFAEDEEVGLDLLFAEDEEVAMPISAPINEPASWHAPLSRRLPRLPKAQQPLSPSLLMRSPMYRRSSRICRVTRRNRDRRWLSWGKGSQSAKDQRALHPRPQGRAQPATTAAATRAARSRREPGKLLAAPSTIRADLDAGYRSNHALLRFYHSQPSSAPIAVEGEGASIFSIYSTSISSVAVAPSARGCFSQPFSFIGDADDEDCTAALASMFASHD